MGPLQPGMLSPTMIPEKLKSGHDRHKRLFSNSPRPNRFPMVCLLCAIHQQAGSLEVLPLEGSSPGDEDLSNYLPVVCCQNSVPTMCQAGEAVILHHMMTCWCVPPTTVYLPTYLRRLSLLWLLRDLSCSMRKCQGCCLGGT